MIIPKTREQIELMRESALLVSKTLGMIAQEIGVGVTTKYLDKRAFEFLKDHGATPSFLGLYNFPNSLCVSPNAQVVHGIPNDKPLESGDVISIDCGAYKNGYHGDHAYSFEIGDVAPEVKRLLQITKESLYIGIKEFKAGNRVGDVANAIQRYCENNGYSVVRELCGHGLGTKIHEEPEMPNFGKRGKGKMFQEGMVVAIEPMINLGTKNVKHLKDGWTILTADGKPSAHFEHDVALINGKPEILSTFDYVYAALGITSNEEDEFRSVFPKVVI
jgi:methionyl aminopeptidase